MLGIPGQFVYITVVLCGGVGMMLTTKDILLMIGAGIMVVLATESFIWAITGYGLIFK